MSPTLQTNPGEVREQDSARAVPLVSVALPVFNGERYLRGAVESILGQTLRDLELILADNASTDETSSICRHYAERDARVRYFRQETNIGAAPNFNFAFRQSRGRYFKWAACDDVLEPQYLERCVEVLESDEEISLAHTGVTCIDEGGNQTDTFELDRTFAEKRLYERFYNLMNAYDFSAIWGVMRREQVARTRLIPLYFGSDRIFLAEMALLGRPHFADERLFRWRLHGASYRNEHMATKSSMASWWSTGVRTWPLRTTVLLFLHASSVALKSRMPVVDKLRCECFLIRWSLMPLIGKLRRRIGGGRGVAKGA